MVPSLVSFTWETPRMSINLIESEQRSQKSLGGTLVSIAVHACLISLAVYATASAVEPRQTPEEIGIIFTPPTPTSAPHTATHPVAARDPHQAPLVPHAPISISTAIPTTLPPIDISHSAIDDSTLFNHGTNGDSGAPGANVAGDGNDTGQPLFAAQVEKQASPRSGNPAPRYPSLLESSRVAGNVLVQFVVDTLGIVDMSTFRVLESSNDLFAESTRATLSKWRFYPAEAGGRRVKQIVQLPLRFVAPHQ
jgi:protein TonB